jgi:uncharacterized protein YaiI (UPF0178 family)
VSGHRSPAPPPPVREEAIRILVDADGCPVKEEVYRVARRYGLVVYVVSNRQIRVPLEITIRPVVVSGRFDAADDWIAENVREDDIAVTSDLLLAERCIRAGALVLTPKGIVHDDHSIGGALATRELLDSLRQMGEMTGGPPPMTQRDRSFFLSRLDELVLASERNRKARLPV